jgi:hypothetical protein
VAVEYGFKPGQGNSTANKPGIRTNREGIYWYKQSVVSGKPWEKREISGYYQGKKGMRQRQR